MAPVEATNLIKRYTTDGPNAVDDISFEIRDGEIFSLLGPNGAGKTTLISVLSTLIAPTAGDARINGHSIRQAPMAVRKSIGVVPQDLAVYEGLSARANLRFWGEMRGLRGAPLKTEIEDKLALTELTERADDNVETFSGGMKRRLNLIIGLLGNPPIIMLDEPTVAIDPQSRRYILDQIKTMNQQGTTILYTTHYMEEAQELSHRIGIVDQGKLIALGSLPELIEMVGSHQMLIIHVNTPLALPEFANALQQLPGIVNANVLEDVLQLSVRSAQAALPLVIDKAAGLGVTVSTIEIREPNLETVFLHLTGKALRD